MVVEKDRQYLIFRLDDGKTVYYNFATKETVGKSGKTVKDLRSQLRNYTIEDVINSVADENYKKFLRYVKTLSTNGITNVGSMLELAKRYAWMEQFFSSGIKITERFRYRFEDVPKGLLKICRQNGFTLEMPLYYAYMSDPDLCTFLFSQTYDFITKNDIKRLLTNDNDFFGIYEKGGTYRYSWNRPVIFMLIKEYNYNPKALFKYLDYLVGYEAIDNVISLAREVQDYTSMASKLSAKYEKYPKNFLTVHRITSRNYSRLKQQFAEQDFKKRIDMDLERRFGDYKFIYPKEIQDIKDEAVQQGNCVASYIQRVIDGECHILFLRKADNEKQSLVTIEVKGGRVVQAKGRFNREITQEEKEVVAKYNNYLSLQNKEADAA